MPGGTVVQHLHASLAAYITINLLPAIIIIVMALEATTLLAYDPNKGVWAPHHEQHAPGTPPIFSSPQLSLCVASWNIWEDSRHHHLRHKFILDTLLPDSSSRRYDIICLQEVTLDFFCAFLAHPTAQEGWFITDLQEQFSLCPNSYSSIIMIRRDYGYGIRLSTSFLEFPSSLLARGFVVAEFCHGDRVVLRIGTAHFESHPEDVRKRRKQFEIAAHVLASPSETFAESVGTDNQITSIPAILAGDFNVRNYAELDYLLSECSFRDAFLVARPIPESESPFVVYPTYGVTLPNRQNKFKHKAGPPNRSDYVFVHGVEVKDGVDGAGFLGDEPVCALDIAKDEEGRDERVWASDHLGIWVKFNLSISAA